MSPSETQTFTGRLFLEGGKKSPKVDFDPVTGKLVISGRSMPEDPVEFYQPVFSWLKEYSAKPKPTTQFAFDIDYLNSTSSMVLMELMKKMVEVPSEVTILWYFNDEDEDIEEVGEVLKEVIGDQLELTAGPITTSFSPSASNPS